MFYFSTQDLKKAKGVLPALQTVVVNNKHQRTISLMKTFVCQLTSPELQKRKATIIGELKSKVVEKRELELGFSYRFRGNDENLYMVFEFIKAERQCCPFFEFQVHVGSDMVTLEVTGEPGAKEFMSSELDL